MTLIPLCLLSAGLSGSTDGESLCTHAAAKCCVSAPRRAQARQLHKSRRLRSVIADVLYLDEVKAALVLAGCSPDSNVWGGHEGKREKGCRHRFSSSLVCVQAADGGRRGTLLFRGPRNLDPAHPRPKHRGLQAGLHPDCLSRYRRIYWGAGSMLSRVPWRHLPLMPPQ